MRRDGVCYNRAMSVPSLAQRVAQVRADPVVRDGSGAGPLLTLLDELVTALGQQQAEIAQLREENRELRRQLDRHSGHSGQPPSQDGPRHRPRSRSQRRAQGPGGPSRAHAASRVRSPGGPGGGALADAL